MSALYKYTCAICGFGTDHESDFTFCKRVACPQRRVPPIQRIDETQRAPVAHNYCVHGVPITEFCAACAKEVSPVKSDLINHPPHYTAHPSGIECITITEHMNFCLGNAVKYIWRAGEKGATLDDLKKARWYVEREISRLERADADKR